MFETPVPQIDQEAYMLYDASVVWTSASAAWEVGPPRTIRASVEYNF